MGKVGSVSVYSTLAEQTDKIVHAHCFEEMTAEEQALLLERQCEGLTVNFITPVRDPLARNVSAFFQTFFRDTGHQLSERAWSSDELRELFLQRYPHDESLDWFDLSFRPVTGIDIYAEPFPAQKKWAVYRNGSYRVLVYRTDLDRGEQLEVISGFLGRKIDKWTLGNRAEDKDYAEIYRKFCSQVVLPDSYISRIGGSRLCRHFWSEAEIQQNAEKWRARSGTELGRFK